MTRRRRWSHGRGRVAWRAAIVAGGAGLYVLALAGTAFAHVTITPGSAPQGSTAELTFRVPNEESAAAMVELQVQVPTAHPIAQLLVRQVPGWTDTVRTVTLAKPLVTDDGSFSTAVSEVTWTGGKIFPGQFQDFSVSADPLPTGVGQLVFKAVQTYSNGDVVRWIDLPQPGQPAPEHPAPVLTLTPVRPDAGTAADLAGAYGAQADPQARAAETADTGALVLGAAGFAFGILGAAAGGAAWLHAGRGQHRRSRRP